MDDGKMPEELYLLFEIKRYGAVNVLGRPMSALEIKRIGIVENIVNICNERGIEENKADWMNQNPDKANLFNYAMGLAIDMGLIDA